ncbi:MAG TPA: hypothetical protein VH021_19125 [Trebonia sp.]|nr:hypothetical protein [Trebonia sp.]
MRVQCRTGLPGARPYSVTCSPVSTNSSESFAPSASTVAPACSAITGARLPSTT